MLACICPPVVDCRRVTHGEREGRWEMHQEVRAGPSWRRCRRPSHPTAPPHASSAAVDQYETWNGLRLPPCVPTTLAGIATSLHVPRRLSRLVLFWWTSHVDKRAQQSGLDRRHFHEDVVAAAAPPHWVALSVMEAMLWRLPPPTPGVLCLYVLSRFQQPNGRRKRSPAICHSVTFPCAQHDPASRAPTFPLNHTDESLSPWRIGLLLRWTMFSSADCGGPSWPGASRWNALLRPSRITETRQRPGRSRRCRSR